MRKLILSAVCCAALAINAKAQMPDSVRALDCSRWIITTVDKMTGTETIGAKDAMLVSQDGKSGLAINMYKWKDDDVQNRPNFLLALIIVVAGAKPCVDEGDQINILFRDGSRMTLENAGKFNCEARATVYFRPLWNEWGGNAQRLRELMEKEIETMRVWTMDWYMEGDFSVEQSVAFKNIIRCLSDATDK